MYKIHAYAQTPIRAYLKTWGMVFRYSGIGGLRSARPVQGWGGLLELFLHESNPDNYGDNGYKLGEEETGGPANNFLISG